MRKSFFIYIFFSSWPFLPAQTFTNSNLPVVVIDTDMGAAIPDETGVQGTMKIIYRGEGQRNYLADQDNEAYLNYNGRIDIEIRGSSTQVLPKKQYGFTTLLPDNISNSNVSLLGMPADNDWVLNGLGFDPALIRDYLCYNLSRQLGQYASRTAYCEVVINGTYKGLYVLQEKVKQGDFRVDVKKISQSDIFSPEVTGGYITKADKTNGDPVAFRMSSYLGTNDVAYIHHHPKPEDAKSQQTIYISNVFLNLGSAATTGNFSLQNGIPSIIDIPSFIDFILLSEFSANVDAYQYSTFFHKDRNGKLRAGPLWDMNLTFGNDIAMWGFDRSKTNTWQFSNGDNEGARFWKDLFNNHEFRCLLSKRWNELISEGKPFNRAVIESYIDKTAVLIGEAAERENNLWFTVGNLSNQILKVKSFIQLRTQWMHSQIGTVSGCPVYYPPSLVINRIMYNPFAEADPEFIEIKNTGTGVADMTGIYFSSPGLVYQFPEYSILPPGQSRILTDDKQDFLVKYGFYPSGEYNRKLANTGMDIVLSDGFGNMIDMVSYLPSPPWPDANGNGSYLELTDVSRDNNEPVNWIAVNNRLVSLENERNKAEISIFPNPVSRIVRINSSLPVEKLELLNIHGGILRSYNPGANESELDLSSFHPGMYLLKVHNAEGFSVFKIVKQ